MILDDIKETLARARIELGAASCTFYIRDPFWQDEFRLIAMPGVRHTEPMQGFSFPPHSRSVLADGDPVIFASDSQSTEQLREKGSTPLDRIPAEKQDLFGDFIRREGIKSSARLWHQGEDPLPQAVLFVNYTETRDFDGEFQEKVKRLLQELIGKLSELSDELRTSEAGELAQAILGIFPPTYGLKKLPDRQQESLVERLESILKLSVKAMGLNPDTTYGTVHLYDRQTGMLNLVASYGKIADPKAAARPLSVAMGEGIVSWVAIRLKGVLINDLPSSEFRKIHFPACEGVRSQVAIPIFDGEHLLGVLNLESLAQRAFPQTCVRALWFAVNRAAEAVRLAQEANISERLTRLTASLLELCAEAVRKRAGKFSLDQLADLAAKELQAARCGIWRYNTEDYKYELSGISPRNFQPKPPRNDGWSSIVKSLKWPIWISIKEAEYEIRYWNGTTWDKPSLKRTPPAEINSGVDSSVKSLLGIPIIVQDQCIGIAWLEYESSPVTHTEDALMNLASGFAAYAGLVIEFSEVDIVDKQAVQEIGDKLTRELLTPGKLDLDGFPNIEVFVKSQNHGRSKIGGDFYAARVIDEQTAGVLVGDGEGHAVQGALSMLPIMAVFEAFWKESRSVTHIMDKIMGVTKKLGVKGSALYCVFTVIEKALWLSVTSAGHVPKLISPDDTDEPKDAAPLIIFPKGPGAEPFPKENSPARGSMLGVSFIKEPLAEARRQLSSGDVIITYTDGLELDFNEVTAAGLPHKRRDPGTIAEAIFKAAVEKRNGEPFTDDVTVLVISVK